MHRRRPGGVLCKSLLAAGLVDTIELGVSPVLLGRPGTAMLPGHRSLPSSVRLELTRHDVFPTGLLVLEYAVRHGSA